jgi:anti-sigma factor RsiW
MNTNEIMQQWEDYFDGALPASERVALETAVIRDPAAQQMRAAVEQARHLRRAALESFMPAPVEADALRSAFLATLHSPAGRVGFPWSRVASIAAMVVLTAGGFWIGRASSSSHQVAVTPTPAITTPIATTGGTKAPTNYIVTITDPDGNVLTRNFDNINDARRYAAQWQQNVADADTPNFPGTGSL